MRRFGLAALTTVAVLALLLSTFSVVKYTQAQTLRERDRIRSDIRGCERGNELRAQIRILGQAQEDLIDGILDTFLTPGPTTSPAAAQRIDAIRATLAPLFVTYEKALAKVDTDIACNAVVPGA